MDTQTRRDLARAMGALFAVLAIALWRLFSPAVGLEKIQVWITALGSWGQAVFFLFYVLAVVLLVPGSILAMIAGLAYGPWGLPLALGAGTTGATISFFVARHLAHRRIQSLIGRNRLWRAVESAISTGGWRIVVLLRLSPVIPFNLLNYFFGITRIRFRHYLPATLLGICPGTIVNVSFAAAGQAITVRGLWHPVNAGLFVLGMLVTVAVGWAIHRQVHVMLKQYRTVEENTGSCSYRVCRYTSFRNFQRLSYNAGLSSSMRSRTCSDAKSPFL